MFDQHQRAEGGRTKLLRMRAAEDVLLKEYDVARSEFDRVQQTIESAECISTAFKQYAQTLRRLRKFLAKEEIPADIMAEVERVCSVDGVQICSVSMYNCAAVNPYLLRSA